MYIQSQKEFKQVTSSLRKELKALYADSAPSHAQCLELLAKALGASSFAEVQAKLPPEVAKPKASVTSRFPLKNKFGLLDLVEKGEEGRVVEGRSFGELEGTVDDIQYCVCYASNGSRSADGSIDPQYEGETDVNWDGQTTRVDSEGAMIWQTQGGDSVSAHQLILVPEDFDAEDEDAGFDLPNREVLLDAYLELAQEKGIVKALLEQVQEDKLESELLDELADTIGFSLHRGELTSLEAMLRVRS